MKENITIKMLLKEGFNKKDASKIVGLLPRYECALYFPETKEVKLCIMNYLWDTTAHQGGIIRLNPRTKRAQWNHIYYGRGFNLYSEAIRRDVA